MRKAKAAIKLRNAHRTILSHGFKIVYWDSEGAQTNFNEKICYIPKDHKYGEEYINSLIVHEAHHVSTAYNRLSLDVLKLNDKELFDWYIKDEIIAYTKQYCYLSAFNHLYHPSKLGQWIIRAKLGYYYRYEVRKMVEGCKANREIIHQHYLTHIKDEIKKKWPELFKHEH